MTINKDFINNTLILKNRFTIYGLTVLFVLTIVLVSSNAYGMLSSSNNINSLLQISTSSNPDNGLMSINHSQMSHMNMNQMDMMKRGDIGMSFNQSKISHQFVITADGGKIIVTALDDNDNQTISQIKNHIKEIQKLFSKGNFTIPFFVHAQKVPGTEVMAKKKYLIDYNIAELKNGSSLILTTNDTEAIDAISQFIKFQSSEHKGY